MHKTMDIGGKIAAGFILFVCLIYPFTLIERTFGVSGGFSDIDLSPIMGIYFSYSFTVVFSLNLLKSRKRWVGIIILLLPIIILSFLAGLASLVYPFFVVLIAYLLSELTKRLVYRRKLQ